MVFTTINKSDLGISVTADKLGFLDKLNKIQGPRFRVSLANKGLYICGSCSSVHDQLNNSRVIISKIKRSDIHFISKGLD